jgi:hypothetical protein
MTGTHEPLDLKPKAAVAFALGMMLMLAGVFATTLFLFDHFAPRSGARPGLATEVQGFPEPRLQIAPHEDLERLNETNRQTLESYGWVDRSAGVARIPIERAMDIVADRGWQEHLHERR